MKKDSLYYSQDNWRTDMIAIWDLEKDTLSYIHDFKEEDWKYMMWFNNRWPFKVVYVA